MHSVSLIFFLDLRRKPSTVHINKYFYERNRDLEKMNYHNIRLSTFVKSKTRFGVVLMCDKTISSLVYIFPMLAVTLVPFEIVNS